MGARVLMLVAGPITHDARVQRCARGLAEHGYDVTVACGAEGEAYVSDLDGYRVFAEAMIRAGARKRAAPESPRRAGRARPAPDVLDAPWRAAWEPLLRREQPDIVHVHDVHGLGAARSACGPATSVIYDAHEYTLGKVGGGRRRVAFAEYLERNVPRADAVVTVSRALARRLEAELGLPSRPLVIHNAPSRAPRPAPYRLRTAVGIDDRTPLLVYTGGMTRRRRLQTPMAALARLPGVHLALVLIGSKLMIELEDACDRFGVRDRVHVLPPVPHDSLVSLIRDADAGIHPLDRYPNGDVALPNKFFEYLQADLPIIVSDSPRMARFVRRHRLGEVASVDDEDAWVRAIERVLVDRAAYEGEPAARDRLGRKWSWEAQLPALLELYAGLAECRAGRVQPAADGSAPLRVLHGVRGSANQPWTLAQALRKRGHESQNIAISDHRFGYKADLHERTKKMGADRLLALVEDLAARFDVFHFHARSLRPSLVDLVQLRLLGKVVVYHFRGTEARLRSEFLRLNPIAGCAPLDRLFPHDEAAQRELIASVRALADAVFVTDPELKTYVPHAEVVPRALDLDEWKPVGPASARRPLVVHAPSRAEVKGTSHVLEAVEALRAEGLPFEFELISGLPHDDARRAYERADVVVDQLLLGWYGVVAVEAMALAKPVVTYVRPDLRGHLDPHPPVAFADPTDVRDVLRTLILDAESRERLGVAGREYCETTHDAARVAAGLERNYRRLLGEARAEPVAGPAEIRRYLLGYGDRAEPRLLLREARATLTACEGPRRNRVSLVVPGQLEGDARARHIAALLTRNDYVVTAVCLVDAEQSSVPSDEGYEIVQARTQALPSVLRSLSPDVIHLRGEAGATAAEQLCQAGARLIYDADVPNGSPPRADAVVASSAAAARRLATAFALESAPRLVRNGASLEKAVLALYREVLVPRDAAWYDRVFAASEKYRMPYASSIYYPCWTAVADRLVALRAATVVDIGCGPGQFAALLRDRGIEGYLGIDFSGVAIELAREACPQFSFQVEDARTGETLEALPYDSAVCLETLEHIEEDREVLARIRTGTPVIGTVPDFPAEAHVRWFRSEKEVAARYEDILADLLVERVRLSRKASLFLIQGVRRG